MPLQRDLPVWLSLTSIYTSPSGLTDPRTGGAYRAGGLYPGIYFDLTTSEAQAVGSSSLYEGRYRFVQVDSTATAANIKTGAIGLMKTLALGVNFITSYDLGLNGAIRPVVFLNTPTATQVAAGAWVFVQELGIATVLGKTSGVTNASPAVGDVINSIALGQCDDLATPGSIVPTTIGLALTAPSHTQTSTFQVLLENVPIVQE
jgi:hypothetical protein